MNAQTMPRPVESPPRPAFGTVLASTMAVATWRDGKWSAHELRKYGPIELSPAIHGLHYGSTCFEGFKAYRWADGSINIFRMDKHVARMRQSAKGLCLPQPDAAQLTTMVTQLVDRVRKEVPEAPGALYLRPMLFGTGASIGGASERFPLTSWSAVAGARCAQVVPFQRTVCPVVTARFDGTVPQFAIKQSLLRFLSRR